MNLKKENIVEMVSYIDLADIKEFVLTHPELVQEEEKKQIFTIGSLVTGVIIAKSIKIDHLMYVLKEEA